MQITGTRHDFGTADVYVDDAAPITAPTRNGNVPATIVPCTFYVEDDDDYGFRDQVTTLGWRVRVDGSLGALVRVVTLNSEVPDEVWEALRTMRPDLPAREARG